MPWGCFNPRTPCGVRPEGVGFSGSSASFNPRTPCGGRRYAGQGRGSPLSFNPRTPCGGRRTGHAFNPGTGQFQSTHSLRSATPRTPKEERHERSVSIHALLAECDWFAFYLTVNSVSFNPRTPCGVRRQTAQNGP